VQRCSSRIDYARITSVGSFVHGIELTLGSGERLTLETFRSPSSFGLSDPRVAGLVRAAAFQALAENERLAGRIRAAMRSDQGTAHRTPARVG